jgi:hypothetical protein
VVEPSTSNAERIALAAHPAADPASRRLDRVRQSAPERRRDCRPPSADPSQRPLRRRRVVASHGREARVSLPASTDRQAKKSGGQLGRLRSTHRGKRHVPRLVRTKGNASPFSRHRPGAWGRPIPLGGRRSRSSKSRLFFRRDRCYRARALRSSGWCLRHCATSDRSGCSAGWPAGRFEGFAEPLISETKFEDSIPYWRMGFFAMLTYLSCRLSIFDIN